MKQTVALLLAVAASLGDAALVTAGPLPGDVAATATLQALFGDAPAWASLVTRTAKAPLVWGTIAFSAFLAALAGGRRMALAAPLAYGLAFAADKALRMVVFAPRPDPDLVSVASASASSGLPSTFGLVYGSLFGLIFWIRNDKNNAALKLLAAGLITAGAAARIVPGGHWPSQMIASVALGLVIAALATFIANALFKQTFK